MTGVILFRAQPFHNGHLNMVTKAFQDCKATNSDLYIFVGSADKSGTIRNPLPIDFRLMLIKGTLHDTFSAEELQKIHVISLDDMTDEADNSYHWGRYLFMKMFNHTKDTDMTIYYSDNPRIMLDWFDAEDRWCLRFKFLDRFENISATEVRRLIEGGYSTSRVLPDYVNMYVKEIASYMEQAKNKAGL